MSNVSASFGLPRGALKSGYPLLYGTKGRRETALAKATAGGVPDFVGLGIGSLQE